VRQGNAYIQRCAVGTVVTGINIDIDRGASLQRLLEALNDDGAGVGRASKAVGIVDNDVGFNIIRQADGDTVLTGYAGQGCIVHGFHGKTGHRQRSNGRSQSKLLEFFHYYFSSCAQRLVVVLERPSRARSYGNTAITKVTVVRPPASPAPNNAATNCYYCVLFDAHGRLRNSHAGSWRRNGYGCYQL